MNMCDLINGRDNRVTIRWVPAHDKVGGNEVADRFAKAATGRTAPCNDANIPDDFLDEASLSYMTRTATEARSQATVEWVSSRIGARRYRPPPGPPAPTQRQKGVGRTVLPVSVRPRSDWVASS